MTEDATTTARRILTEKHDHLGILGEALLEYETLSGDEVASLLKGEPIFRPNTDDHDYDFKKNHAIRFLHEGNRVKAIVQFRGREIAHTDLGRKLLLRFAEDLAQHGAVEGQPRLEGRNAHVIISPVKAASGHGKEPAKEKTEKARPPAPPAPEAAS